MPVSFGFIVAFAPRSIPTRCAFDIMLFMKEGTNNPRLAKGRLSKHVDNGKSSSASLANDSIRVPRHSDPLSSEGSKSEAASPLDASHNADGFSHARSSRFATSRDGVSSSRRSPEVRGSAPISKAISRRTFLVGAGGLASACIAGIAAYAANGSGSSIAAAAETAASGESVSTNGLSVLNVSEDAVFTTEGCEFVDSPDDMVTLKRTLSLPFGTVLWATDDDVATCLLPTSSPDPLVEIGLLSLESGNMRKVLTKAEGSSEGFEVLDARANSNGIIWVEEQPHEKRWRAYTATLDGSALGTPTMVCEGAESWDLPQIAISGPHAYWQLMPKEGGDRESSNSLLLSAQAGIAPDVISADEVMEAASSLPVAQATGDSHIVYVSPGRMCCQPASTEGGVVFCPRAKEGTRHYQLTCLDAESGDVVDKLVLPNDMRPIEVSYGKTGFGFAFDNIYSYGGGIANLGTYVPATELPYNIQSAEGDVVDSIRSSKKGDSELTEKDYMEAAERAEKAVADLYSSTEWFRFPRTPVMAPAWCSNLLLVKSTNVVAVIDLENRKYSSIETANPMHGFGEFLASSSTSSRFVTYANVDYQPLEGAAMKECTVRIWSV